MRVDTHERMMFRSDTVEIALEGVFVNITKNIDPQQNAVINQLIESSEFPLELIKCITTHAPQTASKFSFIINLFIC